jgi:hypothetical protein
MRLCRSTRTQGEQQLVKIRFRFYSHLRLVDDAMNCARMAKILMPRGYSI